MSLRLWSVLLAGKDRITLHTQTVINGGTVSLVWQFQGPSRRDPTLQVYRGLPERDAEVRVHVDNVTFPLGSDETVLVAWSSPDGDYALDTDSQELDFLSPSWTGPAMSNGVAHALWLKKTGDLPTAYLGYGTQPLLMTADTKAMLTLDLGTEKPSSAAISGKVSGHVIGERRNELYLRFAEDDSALQLVDQWDVADDFSYVTPNIPGASATIVAKAVAYNNAACSNWWSRAGSVVQRSVFMDEFVYSIAPDVMRVQDLDMLGEDVASVSLDD